MGVNIIHMIRIKPESIYALRDSTGRALTELMDRLIRHSVSVSRTAQDFVSTNLRVNYQDGGVDTQVSTALSVDRRGYLGAQTAWQYKAVADNTLTKAKLRGEVKGKSKEYLRQLLKAGYAYRICVADNAPPERKTELEGWLDEAIQGVAPGAPASKVLFADDIVAWVNSFPGIAAEITGADLGGFLFFDSWARQARRRTEKFVPTPESESIRATVQSHIRWSTQPRTARLTISGDAGVGKTRTVLEAIAELPEVSSLVIYVDDEEKALEQARAAANADDDLYVVIVADECLDATASQLESLLQGVENRVRVITIDNAFERIDHTDLRLKKVDTQTLERIVEANFPNVAPDRRYQYCRLAEGSLRFAVTLCENDGIMLEEGNLAIALRDATTYLNRYFDVNGRFKEEDRRALEIICLVERCGVFGGVFSELQSLCDLVGANAVDVRERLELMQKSNGLVGRAGRFLYVTPMPVATACFHRAWKRWIEPDAKSFLEKFPRTLMQSFLARLQRAPEGVGKVVNDYFRHWIVSRGPGLFRSNDDTEQLLLLVRSDPDQMIPRLRQLVARATDEDLASGYQTGRRWLLSDLDQIASFPLWFDAAEEMLLRLSLNDPEPELGNNATSIWSGLYPIIAPVATPFSDRFEVLKRRIASESEEERYRCVFALSEVLHDSSVRMMNPGTYGHRLAPSSWRPQTWDEYFGYITEAIRVLVTLCEDPVAKVREKAIKTLVSSVRSLIFRGILGPAKEGAEGIPSDIRPILRAELREFLLLNNSEHSPQSAEEKEQRSRFVSKWIEELATDDLHSLLVEEIGPDAWDHHLEQEAWEKRIRDLAMRLLESDEEFRKELPWLDSPQAKSIVEFGTVMGRFDQTLTRLDAIVESAKETKNPNFARGYFLGVTNRYRDTVESRAAQDAQTRLNQCLDSIWDVDPVLAYYVMVPSGAFVRALHRTITAIEDKTLPAASLQNFQAWDGPVPTSPQDAKLAAQALWKAALAGDKRAASVGVGFIVHLLLRYKPEDRTEFLEAVFGEVELDTVFGLLEQNATGDDSISPYFGQIFSRILPANPTRGIDLAIKMVSSKDFEVSREGGGLFHAVVELDPIGVMQKLGEVLLSDNDVYRLSLQHVPLLALPAHVIKEWLDEHGLDGARVIARYLPRPHLNGDKPELHPVAQAVLERYGTDDQVFSRWVAGMTGGVVAGSLADWVERRAEYAEKFLGSPVEAVRKWAESEIGFSSEHAADFRLSEEERY
jgi:hypothetical protein